MYVGVGSEVVSACMCEWVVRWSVHVCGSG